MKLLLAISLLLFTTISCEEYTLSGSIIIHNECTEMPATVSVSALAINEQQREVKWDKHRAIKLEKRADGSYHGIYKLKIKWRNAETAPTHWTTPKIWAEEWSWRTEICESLHCEALVDTFWYDCIDMATRPRRIPVQGADTGYALRSDCQCDPNMPHDSFWWDNEDEEGDGR